MTQCSISGCPGNYEARIVTHTVRSGADITVVDGVPADVCDVCGDVLLEIDTVRRIEAVLAARENPVSSAPVFDLRRAG